MEDLESFIEYIYTLPNSSKRHLPRLICVFYLILDPAPISGLLASSDDTPSASAQNTAARALLAVEGFVNFFGSWWDFDPREMPLRAAFRDIWPRIWAWAQFHDTFCESLDFGYSPAYIYHSVVGAIHGLLYRLNLDQDVVQTPHLYEYLGRAWATITAAPPSDERLAQLGGFGEMIERVCTRYPGASAERLEQLAVGAGGPQELARLCVSNLGLAFPNLTGPLTPFAMGICGGVLSVILDSQPASGDDVAFRHALYNFGAVSQLTIALQALLASAPDPIYSKYSESHSDDVLDCFSTIMAFFHEPFVEPAEIAFVEALKAGFLPAAYAAWRQAAPDYIWEADGSTLIKDHTFHVDFLLSPLVLTELSRWNLDDVDDTSSFVDLRVAGAWKDIIRLLRAHLALLSKHNAERSAILRGCDNPQCGCLHAKKDLKRCGTCRLARYCSRACQKRDWMERHRTYCDDSAIQDDSRQERLRCGFIRSLLDSWYTLDEEDVALELLRLFVRRGPDILPYVLFDYKDAYSVGCRVTVAAIEDNPELGERFAEDVDRARNSGGRVHLHFLTSHPEEPYSSDLFPFYTTGGGLYEGLRKIAAGLSSVVERDLDLEIYRGQIRQLLAEEREACLKTH
ncbi:hypothetical protein C8F01DRAFT_1162076 [Mycena amicta]|nr:hypothetical protein C8F01DRAFT_1162076 [Mycena amicta]